MWSIVWVALVIFLIRAISFAVSKMLREDDSQSSGVMLVLFGMGMAVLKVCVLYGWFLNRLFRYLEVDIRYSVAMGVAIICVKLVFETLHED